MESTRKLAGSQQNVSTNKVERKVMEKNRRNHMKLLYSKLNSLLPTNQSNESPLTVSDQIEEAIKYIKSLETKLKEDKEKKERLLRRSTLLSSSSSSSYTAPTRSRSGNSPELKIKEMGSAVEVVFTSGFENQSLFYEVIYIFYEERAEIINVNYSILDDTVFYLLHAEIEDVMYEFGATKLTERLKRLVYKWKSDAEMQAAAASSSGHGGTRPPADTPTTSSGSHF